MAHHRSFVLVLYIWSACILSSQGLHAFSQHGQQSTVLRRRTERKLAILDPLACTYNECLTQNYWLTQSVIGGVFSGMGDAMAQGLSRPQQQEAQHQQQQQQQQWTYSPLRSRNYFCKGLGGGVMWASWFSVSDEVSLAVQHALGFGDESLPIFRVLISILLEQIAVCPIFYVFWDIPVPALLSGTPARQIPNQIQDKLGPLLVANAKVWTPVNMVTYSLPVEYRLLCSSSADLIWQVVLSRITSKEVSVVNEPSTAPALTSPSEGGLLVQERVSS